MCSWLQPLRAGEGGAPGEGVFRDSKHAAVHTTTQHDKQDEHDYKPHWEATHKSTYG